MNYLISIIVPVYNVEDYLRECLDSIVNQTYKNLDIILVDDGSTDSSGKICDEYADKDNRIRVVHNKNHGVSYSRNCGLDIAKGEYILFIDSDDIVKNNYVFEMVKELDEKDYDLIVSNIIDVWDNIKQIRIKNFDKLSGTFYNDYFDLKEVLRGPWGKLYKKFLLDKFNIKFLENMKVAEDQVFNFEYYSVIKMYKFIDLSGYEYYHRNTFSLSKLVNQIGFENELKKLKKEKDFYNKNNVFKKEYIFILHCLGTIDKYVYLSNKNDSYNNFKDRVLKIKELLYGFEYYNNVKQKIALIFLKHNIIFPLYLWYGFKHYKHR